MYHTMILTDGTACTVDALAIGPGGMISGHADRPILYLKDAKHGRYYCVPEEYSDADLPALRQRIQTPPEML
jgi:hypothetical protein